MAGIFKAVLDISLAASALALLALAARLVIGRRPNAVLPLLSLLVILRLAIPAVIPSPLSVMNLFQDIRIEQPTAEAANVNEAAGNEFTQTSANTAADPAANPTLDPAVYPAEESLIGEGETNTGTNAVRSYAAADEPALKGPSFMEVASIIWAAGVAAMAACIAASNIRFTLTLKKNRRYDLPGFGELLQQCKEELNIRGRIEAVQLSGINTAAVYGVFRPKLLISPSFGWLSEQEKRHVLLHELSHVKRRDTLVCLLITALSAVYWFNPVLWIALALARRDMEVMCDMAVLKLTQDKRSYASTLFSLAKASGSSKPKLVTALFIGPQNALRFGVLISTDSIKRRMKMITRYKKSRLFTAVSIILVIAIAITGCTGAVSGNVNTAEFSPALTDQVLVSRFVVDYSAFADDAGRVANIEKAAVLLDGTVLPHWDISQSDEDDYLRQINLMDKFNTITQDDGWQKAPGLGWDNISDIAAKADEDIFIADSTNYETTDQAGGGLDLVIMAAYVGGGHANMSGIIDSGGAGIKNEYYDEDVTLKIRTKDNNIIAEYYVPEGAEKVHIIRAPESNNTPGEESSPAPTIDPNDWRQKFPGKFSDTVEQTENSYKDANISITIEKVQKDGATYFIADIYIKDLKYFRTAFAADADKMGKREPTDKVAEEVNAILAINGDNCVNITGTVVRNGQMYREKKSSADVLVMNYDGSMQAYSPDEFDVKEAEGAYQVWSFGPMLLKDGKPMTEFNSNVGLKNPRTAVGYYEPGHYCFVVVDGRQPGYSDGFTLTQLSQLFADLGCTVAYSMDGGNSSAMAFMGKLINKPCNGGRKTADIIYIGE